MKTFFKTGVALALAATMMTAIAAPASADYYYRHGGGGGAGVAAGVAAGILGLGILGAATAHEGYYAGEYCHPGPLECRMFEPPCFHDEDGAYVCPRPERRCFRRPYCE